MVGRRVKTSGEVGTVTRWDPLSESMCDVLIKRDDGHEIWVSSRNLNPIDGGVALQTRQEAREIARLAAITQLQSIKQQHINDFRKPWPGAEHGKVTIGRAIDGALRDLQGVENVRQDETASDRRK